MLNANANDATMLSQRESTKIKTFPFSIQFIPYSRTVHRVLKNLYFPCHYLRLHERDKRMLEIHNFGIRQSHQKYKIS